MAHSSPPTPELQEPGGFTIAKPQSLTSRDTRGRGLFPAAPGVAALVIRVGLGEALHFHAALRMSPEDVTWASGASQRVPGAM